MSERANMERRLYDAALSGSVLGLDALMEEDELILDRVSLSTSSFDGTPLHVAALRGHLDFIKAVLSRNPNLATELDSMRCSPLHLASAKGHVEIVHVLLRANTDVCKARDQDGRTPLHLAAIKGRVEVVRELLQARPESIHEKLGRGETIMHLCVKYNRFEALKALGQYVQSNGLEFLLNSEDDDGNTILHLAAAFKQMDTVEYLVGIKSVKDNANIKNQKGSTALDVLEHCPNRDLKFIEIRELLMRSGVQRAVHGGDDHIQPKSPAYLEDQRTSSPPDINPPPQTCCGGIGKSMSRFWKTYLKVDDLWLKEVRGHLITAATLTATMAYQGALSPPGSGWQDFVSAPTPNSNQIPGTSDDYNPEPSIMARHPDSFVGYLIVNTAVLIASLSTIMLALSGFPLANKFLLWLLIFAMYSTITCTAVGYLLVLSSVVLEKLWDYAPGFGEKLVTVPIFTWLAISGFVAVLHVCNFFVWLWKKCQNLNPVKRFQRRREPNGNSGRP